MVRSAPVARAVSFVLVAMGLVALTGGPSIVDMTGIHFVGGIPGAAVAVVDEPASGLASTGLTVSTIPGTAADLITPFTSAPPLLPRRASTQSRTMLVTVVVLLAALVLLAGAPSASGVRRRTADLSVRVSALWGARRRLRRRAPPLSLV